MQNKIPYNYYVCHQNACKQMGSLLSNTKWSILDKLGDSNNRKHRIKGRIYQNYKNIINKQTIKTHFETLANEPPCKRIIAMSCRQQGILDSSKTFFRNLSATFAILESWLAGHVVKVTFCWQATKLKVLVHAHQQGGTVPAEGYSKGRVLP